MDETTPRVRKVLVTVGSTLTAVEELRISAGSNVTLTATTSNRRTTLTIASSGGGGTSDHAALTHLAWTASAHTGTASRLAGFDGAGAAAYYQIGADVQAWDADLDAVAGLGTTGLAVRTGAGTWTTRVLTAPAAGLTITNPGGVGGSPTFALADDLAALEALSGTGYPKRTGTSTWSVSSTVPWSDVSSTPTTLSGYGISNGLSTSTSWGGDLSGTGASPTVTQARGLRETAGPTTLMVGAVADGQYLRRSGSTVVGAWLSLALATSGRDTLDIPSDGGSALPFSLSSTAGSVA